MRPVAIVILMLATVAHADRTPDLAQLLALGPAGLPVAFEGASFGESIDDLPKTWKAFRPEVGRAEFGDFSAMPWVDSQQRVDALALYPPSSIDRSDLAKLLVTALGKPGLSGGSGAMVWWWSAHRIRASTGQGLAVWFVPYRPLSDVKLDALLKVAGMSLTDAEHYLGVAAQRVEDYLRYELRGTEFGTLCLTAMLVKGRLASVDVLVAYPSGATSRILDELRPLVGGALTATDRDDSWQARNLQLHADLAVGPFQTISIRRR